MSSPGVRAAYRFGEFEYDAVAYELRRNGRRLRLARQPMDLLQLLLERPGELVSRDDIGKHLWSDQVFVDLDAGIRTSILKIRKALDDAPESARFVETVPGKGYRFVAAVERIAVKAAPTAASPAPGLAGDARRHNLPADLTSFVGREQALTDLRRLLFTCRLLSLTGSGGVGKTRLATRLAGDVVDDFPGGVWLVDLASISRQDLIAQSVAGVCGVRESPNRMLRDALIDYLRDRELLLLFDTCEHLIDGCAELAEALLRAAPALRIVATSREALRVPGETIYRVESLSVPGESPSRDPESLEAFEATRLFLARAAASQTDFTADRDAAGAIASICRRLEGIPLAIELAAAQSGVLSPQDIESRLAEGWLTSAMRTSITRQRTLDATIDWSYQLLSDSERLLFNRLSIFPGSWTIAAAEQVCGGNGIDPAQMSALVSRLANVSLVTASNNTPGARRYHFLDTVRQYAQRRLADAGSAADLGHRHFAYFRSEFRDSLHTLTGPNQGPLLRQLHLELENVRAALDHGLSSPELQVDGVELAGTLFWFWTKRGLFAEGRDWLERAAAIPAPRALRARVALGLGHMDYFQGRFADMMARNDEILACAREEHDDWLVTMALFGSALGHFEGGAFDEAAALAVAARDASGQASFSAPLLVLGNVALVRGDQNGALALFEEAIDGLRQAGEIWGLGIVLSLAAGLLTIRGDFDRARACASEAMAIYRELEDPRGIAWSLDVFAGQFAAAGRAQDAARVWGASDGLLESVGGTLVPTIGWIRERYLARTITVLGQRSFERARAEGRAMTLEQAVALAGERVALPCAPARSR